MLKKLLPAFSLAALAVSAYAQNAITLTETDIISVGNTAYLVTDTATVSKISSEAIKSGANVTWDFSGLHAHVSDQVDFVAPSSTNYGSYYSQSNLCAITQSTGYNAYFNSSTSGFVMTGIVGDLLENGMNVKAFLTPGQTLMEFPSTYQSKFSSPFVATVKEYYGKYETIDINGFQLPVYVDSVSAVYTYSVESEIDGYGTMITPIGSYNALRQFVTETEVDSQFAYVQGMGWIAVDIQTYTTYRLRWWANGIGYALVECKLNNNKTKVKGEVQYVSSTNIVTSIAGIDFDDEILMYPNPAQSSLRFSNLPKGAEQLVISDITGKEIDQLDMNGTNNDYDLETNSFNNGVYFYTILNENGNVINKGKFSVLH